MNLEDFLEMTPEKAPEGPKMAPRRIPGLTVIKRFIREDPALLNDELQATLGHIDHEAIRRFYRDW